MKNSKRKKEKNIIFKLDWDLQTILKNGEPLDPIAVVVILNEQEIKIKQLQNQLNKFPPKIKEVWL